jgi:hypothetical protein
MKKIKITKIVAVTIKERAKYERINRHENYIDSVKRYNEFVYDNFEVGDTVEIKRINQALAVFNYAYASAPGGVPAFYNACIDENGVIFMTANYRNVDDWKNLSTKRLENACNEACYYEYMGKLK